MLGAFAAVYLGWGSTYLAIKVALESLPPFTIGAVRFFIAGIALYAFARLRGASKPTLTHWRNATAIGGLMFVVGNGFVIWAERRVDSGVAALFIASLPVVMTLFSLVHKNSPRPKPVTLLGIALGMVGVVILIKPFSAGPAVVPFADAAKLAGAIVCWASGSLFAKKAELPKSTALAVAMEMMMGGVLFFVVAFFSGELATLDIAAVTTRSWLAVVYLAVVGSLIAFTAYMWLLQNVPLERASTYAYVNPIVAVALGSWLGGERISASTLGAGAIIILSVIMILRPGLFTPKKKLFGSERFLLS